MKKAFADLLWDIEEKIASSTADLSEKIRALELAVITACSKDT